MNKRPIWGAVAALAALYIARVTLKTLDDLRRYNHMLAMSNEGTFQQELPELLPMAVKQQRQSLNEWMEFIRSAPRELLRYLKIESM
jgi:hypothetical protein